MMFRVAAILCAPVGQHPCEWDAVAVEERYHAIVEQVGGRQWRPTVIERCERHLRVGIDKGLLINATHAVEGAEVERILGAVVAGSFGFEFPMCFPFQLARPSAASCDSVSTSPSWADFASSALKRLFMVCRS
jgi:hypothetical protein